MGFIGYFTIYEGSNFWVYILFLKWEKITGEFFFKLFYKPILYFR